MAGVAAGYPTYRAWAEAAVADASLVPPAGRLLGFRMTAIEDGRAEFVLDAGPQHANPMGTLHGGVLCDVLDAALTSAVASTLGPGESVTTLDLSVRFLRPHWTGRVHAVGRVVRSGRTIAVAEGEARDEQGRLLAHATTSCMILRAAAAAGR